MASGLWALLHKNSEAWDAAYQRATEAGLLVLDCTYEQGITVPCTLDLNDREQPGEMYPRVAWARSTLRTSGSMFPRRGEAPQPN